MQPVCLLITVSTEIVVLNRNCFWRGICCLPQLLGFVTFD